MSFSVSYLLSVHRNIARSTLGHVLIELHVVYVLVSFSERGMTCRMFGACSQNMFRVEHVCVPYVSLLSAVCFTIVKRNEIACTRVCVCFEQARLFHICSGLFEHCYCRDCCEFWK